MTLGQKIRSARLERRLTQEQLGGRQLSKSYVSELERGHRTPRLATLQILARRLKRPLSFFLEGATEDEEPEAFLTVGLAHLYGHSLTEAAAWFKRASDILSDEHDELLSARIELALAIVDQRLGQDLRAWRRVERLLPVLARNDDRGALVRAHICLGRAKLAAGDSSSAAWTLEAGLHLVPLPELDPLAVSALYHYLGIARLRLGETNEAADAFRKAVEVAESHADPQRAGMWRVQRAIEAAEENAYDKAMSYAGEAIAIYDSLEHKRRLAEIHWHLGDLEAATGRWKEAHRHYSISVMAYKNACPPRASTRRLVSLVETLHECIPPEGLRAIGEIVLALFPDDRCNAGHEDRAGTLWLRGTTERLLGRTSDARASLTASLHLFETLQRTEEVRNVRRELALLAVESDDLSAAREYLTALAEPPAAYRLSTI